MAGTLVLLQRAGWATHYLNVANGCCGSVQYDARKTRIVRRAEAKNAAKVLGAHFHESFCNDLEILYDLKLVRRLAAVIREVKPNIVLTHSPVDYMEDHTNTSRLAATAAFAHAMPNFRSAPPRPTAEYDVTVYHAMPHSLRDPLRRLVVPGAFVNTASVQEIKRAALAEHKSQQNWLDVSQGLNSIGDKIDEMALAVGKLSKKFKFAEGWRRHLHYGFSATEVDPLREVLGKNYLVNKTYERESKSSLLRPR
ncbi:MAG: PIG-L family deacetylase [Verrucomicrobia bacterium]|nr:PIG-L family deacetylase [Verrucomicrobiota bacterium]